MFYNPLALKIDYVYDLNSGGDLQVCIDERGNTLEGVYLGEDETAASLRRGQDFDETSGGIVLYAAFLALLKAGVYTRLCAVYNHGAAVPLPIYAHSEPLPKAAVLFDPSALAGTEIRKQLQFVRVTDAFLEEVTEELPFGCCVGLSYDAHAFAGKNRPAVRTHKRSVNELPAFDKVAVWVWGDGSGNRLNYYIQTADGFPLHSKNEYVIDWHGWKRLGFLLEKRYSPPACFHQLFEFSYMPQGSPRGTLKVGLFEAIYDDCLLPQDMGTRTVYHEPLREPLKLDYSGGEIGGETIFTVTSNVALPEGEGISLVADFCALPDGTPLPAPFTVLRFSSDGTLRTNGFTGSDMPADLLCWLHARSDSGFTSGVLQYNTFRKQALYALAAPTPVRSVTKTPDTTAAFTWFGDDETAAGRVVYAVAQDDSPAHTVRAVGAYAREWVECFRLPHSQIERIAERNRGLCSYKVMLEGLLPDTAYCAVFMTGEQESNPYIFRTLPARVNDFSLVVLTDAQIKNETYAYALLGSTLQAALERTSGPRLMVTLGDMVDSVGRQEEYARLNDTLAPHITQEIWMPTPGNHDECPYRGFANYLDHVNLPGSVSGLADGLFYTVVLGEYALISAAGSGNDLPSHFAQALEAELASVRDVKWKIVLTHASPFGKSGERFTLAKYAPLFERYAVDLVLSGHDHVYIRSSVKNAERVRFGEGVTYCVLGSCGVSTDPASLLPWHDYVYGGREAEIRDAEGHVDQMYAIVRCTQGLLRLSAYTRSGKQIDEFILEK